MPINVRQEWNEQKPEKAAGVSINFKLGEFIVTLSGKSPKEIQSPGHFRSSG